MTFLAKVDLQLEDHVVVVVVVVVAGFFLVSLIYVGLSAGTDHLLKRHSFGF